jgi:hypothetical protein
LMNTDQVETVEEITACRYHSLSTQHILWAFIGPVQSNFHLYWGLWYSRLLKCLSHQKKREIRKMLCRPK